MGRRGHAPALRQKVLDLLESGCGVAEAGPRSPIDLQLGPAGPDRQGPSPWTDEP